MTPWEPPPAGPTVSPAHGGHRTQPHANPSLCASIIRFSSRERPGSVPPWLPMDISAPSHVLIPVVSGSSRPQGWSTSRQGKGLEGSVPSLILDCGNVWGHAAPAGSTQSVPRPALLLPGSASRVGALHSGAGSDSHSSVSAACRCRWALPAKGAELCCGHCWCPPGAMAAREGRGMRRGPALWDRNGVGVPVFPGGSRSVGQHPIPFLPLPLSSSSFAEPRSGVLGCSVGSPRGVG